MLEIFRTVAVLTAPILSFTAEEAWQALPAALRGDAESIFDIAFPALGAVDVPALELWDALRALRAQVAAAKGERDFQLDARVSVPAARLDAFRALGDGLREALVVSSLRDLRRVVRRHGRGKGAEPRPAKSASAAGSFFRSGPTANTRRSAHPARRSYETCRRTS